MVCQARRNGFEHGGDSKYTITFEPFIAQTSNLQFLKWQVKSQNMVGTSIHVRICSGRPGAKLSSPSVVILGSIEHV